MAVAAASVNVFQTITSVVGTSTVGIYTAPVGYTGVVLLSQVTNIGGYTQTISFGYRRSGVDTEIIKDLAIPANDTANFLWLLLLALLMQHQYLQQLCLFFFERENWNL